MDSHPIDEWLVAESVDGRHAFLIHTQVPRFVAEICDDAQLAPFVYAMTTGQELAWFAWWDAPPSSDELTDLLACAELAIIAYDAQLGVDDNIEEPTQ